MCRANAEGGRRCPSHSDKNKVSAYNAIRRARYQANKLNAKAQNTPTVNTANSTTTLSDDVLNRLNGIDPQNIAAPIPESKWFSEEPSEDMLKAMEEADEELQEALAMAHEMGLNEDDELTDEELDALLNDPRNLPDLRIIQGITYDEWDPVVQAPVVPAEPMPTAPVEFIPVSNEIVDGFDINHPILKAGLLTVTDEVTTNRKLNIAKRKVTGKMVDNGYVAGNQLTGQINYTELDENSYKEFGFRTPPMNSNEKNSTTPSLGDKPHVIVAEYSELEMKNFSEKDKVAMKIFTGDDYSWLNSYYNGFQQELPETSISAERFDQAYYKRTVLDSSNRSFVSQDQRSKKLAEEIATRLDAALSKGPGVQRIVYRGIKSTSNALDKYLGNADAYLANEIAVGKEVKFDGFASSSCSADVAGDYADGGNKGILFEILTPQGVNATSVSAYSADLEVLLPRNTRYMIVGVHQDRQLTRYSDRPTHVVQMVAINDKGEILTGKN